MWLYCSLACMQHPWDVTAICKNTIYDNDKGHSGMVFMSNIAATLAVLGTNQNNTRHRMTPCKT